MCVKSFTGSYASFEYGAGRDRVRARRAERERVAVGRGLRDGIGADRAAGAGLVLDDDALSQLLGSFCATMRATMSVEPPGAKPTTSLMGRLG
jgi:hypothetical protein